MHGRTGFLLVEVHPHGGNDNDEERLIALMNKEAYRTSERVHALRTILRWHRFPIIQFRPMKKNG
jgi:hypothetical protein